MLKAVLKSYKKYFLAIVTAIFLHTFIYKVFGISLMQEKTGSLRDTELPNDSFFIGLVRLIIIAPLVEEFIFRLPLVPSKRNLIILIALALIFFPIYLGIGYNTSIFCFYYSIMIFHIGAILLSRNWPILFHKNFVLITSSIAFGLLHYIEFPNFHIGGNFIHNILNILPLIYCGYLLSKLRLIHGIKHSILLHILINITACAGYLLNMLLWQ